MPRENYAEPLTDERLFGWQAALFPTGRSGMRKIIVGAWRDDASGPMQVVSGPVGQGERSLRSAGGGAARDEMARFLDWFNARAMAPTGAEGGASRICGS